MITVLTLLLEDDNPLAMLRNGRYEEVQRTRRGGSAILPAQQAPPAQERRIAELEGRLAVALDALREIRQESKPPISIIATFALAKVQEE